MKKVLSILGILLMFAAQGFASSGGYEHGDMEKAPKLAINGYCPVCVVNGKLMEGSKDFSEVFNGIEYRFPGEKQHKMFREAPWKYIGKDMETKFHKLMMKHEGMGEGSAHHEGSGSM